jgi:mannose-6-phosphate isomerase-like protein (cupin superfamily)
VNVRRVVTGHDAQGHAVFVNDDVLPPTTAAMLPGVEFHRVWGADTVQQFPNAGALPPAPLYFPPVGGFRFGLFTLPPAGTALPHEQLDAAAAFKELDEKLPGLVQYMEPDAPGMHTTPTVDIDLVLSGEVVLELDNGAMTTLRPGDSVVQNGTRHRWRNEGTTPATIAYFICGAGHAKFR